MPLSFCSVLPYFIYCIIYGTGSDTGKISYQDVFAAGKCKKGQPYSPLALVIYLSGTFSYFYLKHILSIPSYPVFMVMFPEVFAGNRLVLFGLLTEIKNADHLSKVTYQRLPDTSDSRVSGFPLVT